MNWRMFLVGLASVLLLIVSSGVTEIAASTSGTLGTSIATHTISGCTFKTQAWVSYSENTATSVRLHKINLRVNNTGTCEVESLYADVRAASGDGLSFATSRLMNPLGPGEEITMRWNARRTTFSKEVITGDTSGDFDWVVVTAEAGLASINGGAAAGWQLGFTSDDTYTYAMP